jgi:hypothetical protein
LQERRRGGQLHFFPCSFKVACEGLCGNQFRYLLLYCAG